MEEKREFPQGLKESFVMKSLTTIKNDFVRILSLGKIFALSQFITMLQTERSFAVSVYGNVRNKEQT